MFPPQRHRMKYIISVQLPGKAANQEQQLRPVVRKEEKQVGSFADRVPVDNYCKQEGLDIFGHFFLQIEQFWFDFFGKTTKGCGTNYLTILISILIMGRGRL